MRFFMNRHYSTAQKIIESVEARIIDRLNACKRVVPPSNLFDELFVYIQNRRKLAEKLGDVLKDCIDNGLYNKYQKLTEIDKKEFRNNIANAYFGALINALGELKNIKIDFDKVKVDNGHIYPASEYIFAEVNLPKEFFDKEFLHKALYRSLLLAQQLLFTSENNNISMQRTN